MNSRLKWISRGITLLLTYLLASAPEKKLLFFEGVFTDGFHTAIFDHSLLIVIILLLAFIAFEIIISFRNSNKMLKNQCHNACHYIYRYIEKNIGQDFANNSRVTIFKAIFPNTEKVYLKAISRYQTKEPYRLTKLKFRPGEGVVGACFETNSLILENKLPEYEKDTQLYKEISSKNYNLNDGMINKIKIKSCFLLGIPIKSFDTERTWGVLVIDSAKKPKQLNKGFVRVIEDIIKHYTVFFMEGEK